MNVCRYSYAAAVIGIVASIVTLCAMVSQPCSRLLPRVKSSRLCCCTLQTGQGTAWQLLHQQQLGLRLPMHEASARGCRWRLCAARPVTVSSERQSSLNGMCCSVTSVPPGPCDAFVAVPARGSHPADVPLRVCLVSAYLGFAVTASSPHSASGPAIRQQSRQHEMGRCCPGMNSCTYAGAGRPACCPL